MRLSKLLYLTIQEFNCSTLDFDISKTIKAPISKSLKVFKLLILVHASKILKTYSLSKDSNRNSYRSFCLAIHWLSMSTLVSEFKRWFWWSRHKNFMSIFFKLSTYAKAEKIWRAYSWSIYMQEISISSALLRLAIYWHRFSRKFSLFKKLLLNPRLRRSYLDMPSIFL